MSGPPPAQKELGQRLFGEPALYFDYLDLSDSGPVVDVKRCRYYEVASNLIRLEEETFSAIMRGRMNGLPLRDEAFLDAETAQAAAVKPFPVGCPVVLALRRGDGYQVAVHTRSHETSTFGGAKSVTPNFGLMPVVGSSDGRPVGLLYYNFLKEYLEELYGYDELNRMTLQRRADPRWFYGIPEARMLLESPHFSLETLGMGFNALNGVLVLPMLARVDDVDVAARITGQVKVNGETGADHGDELDGGFVPVDSPRLAAWPVQRRYNPASAFGLGEALRRLDAPSGTGPVG
ncbi:hypothetical protein ACIBFB_09270 [Nocardiopsis sp. NPDC050513]|uniref:hypothetical protein n=1 Tax=Nocardiopsis sp. NPDC050513 TaxID=3364338 RepID=UPI0037BD418F